MNEQSLTEMLIEVRDSVRDIKHNQDLIQQSHQLTHSEVVRLRRIITGESEPERGLVLRVDRLERSHERTSTISQTAIGAAITAIVGAMLAAIGIRL
jgi:hypothetical protein